jgi:RND family efflux transporter MFP subunit
MCASSQPYRVFASLALSALLAAFLVGCEKAPPAKGGKNPKVVVTKPITDTVVDYQDFTGRLDAFKTVEIRAHVSGYITEAPFKEGDLVKEGQILFQIDKRPFEADVNQAVANLNVAIADREFQVKNAERLETLPSNAATKQEVETAVAARDKAVATVKAMQATLDRARLYLDYTHVISPVSGRVSRRMVDPGNLAIADNTLLTTVVSDDPVYAYFDVDERTYLDLMNWVAPVTGTPPADLKLSVAMRLANEKEFERVGTVDFVDNRVISNTGTIRMRGFFPNHNGRLKSGLFMRARLPTSNPYQAILIPDEAVQSDQERKYVWIVNANNEVQYRSVKLGQALQEMRVILPPETGQEGKEGVMEGEQVIISGMQRVHNGSRVDAELRPPPPPPKMSLLRLLASKGQDPGVKDQKPEAGGQKSENVEDKSGPKGEGNR